MNKNTISGDIFFRRLFPLCILYALVSTFCIYHNISGITMPFFGVATLIFLEKALHRLFPEHKGSFWNFESKVLALFFEICCCSNVFTDKLSVLVLNQLFAIFLFCCLQVSLLFSNTAQSFGEYLSQLCTCLGKPLEKMFQLFSDLAAIKQARAMRTTAPAKQKNSSQLLLGIVLAIPAVLFALLLLCSADAVFAHMLTNISIDFELPDMPFGILLCIVLLLFVSYGLVHFFSSVHSNTPSYTTKNWDGRIATATLLSLACIYSIFIVIQIRYLFFHNGLLPDGMTYATYARRGFFELLLLCMLNMGLILFVDSHFGRTKWNSLLLIVISLCTFGMIASSAMRMILYIQVYLLTTLRVFVLWALVVLCIWNLLALLHIIYPNRQYYKVGGYFLIVMYLGFALSHTDYFIARYNLSQASTSTLVEVDNFYLMELSADASKVLFDSELSNAPLANKYYANLQLSDHDDIRNFNLSRYLAKQRYSKYISSSNKH